MSDQPTSVAAVLPMTDILPLVLEYLTGDIASLYACALVDNNSNRAASAILYRIIVFSPPWTATLDLNEARKYSVRSYTTAVCACEVLTLITTDPQLKFQRPGTILHSATLPHHVAYVKTVEIGGMDILREGGHSSSQTESYSKVPYRRGGLPQTLLQSV